MGIRTGLRHQDLYDPAPPAEAEPAPAAGGAGRPFGRNQPLWGIPARATASTP